MRLVTKCDIDGLACGILLKERDVIDRIAFAHPKEVESGKVEITGDDITAGLPYREEAHLAFDHYPSPIATDGNNNLIIDRNLPSTSRVIHKYYGCKYAACSPDMLDAVDKGYSGNISIDEILYPTGWILLNYLIDHRTGLESYKQLSMSNSELIIKLTDFAINRNIWDILSLPETEERLDLYFDCIDQYKDQILRCSSVHYNLLVVDMRKETHIYPGNRFMMYALFPECNVSLQVLQNQVSGMTTFVAGKSVIDRSYNVNIGGIMRAHGGGGHLNAGTCQTASDNSEKVLERLISDLKYSSFRNLFYGYFNYYCSR
ncbi:MAG: exopolyphosphatase [Nitrospirae bacterium]|nr:exopolyphosphatase [Nitrospirota bacterium]